MHKIKRKIILKQEELYDFIKKLNLSEEWIGAGSGEYVFKPEFDWFKKTFTKCKITKTEVNRLSTYEFELTIYFKVIGELTPLEKAILQTNDYYQN